MDDWAKQRLTELLAAAPVAREKAAKRKPFKAKYVQLPDYWIEQLERSRRPATYKLALRILREVFKRKHVGGEVVLSTEVTGLPRQTRWSATQEMVKLNLIQIRQDGNQAVRVTKLVLKDCKPKPTEEDGDG